MILKILLVIAVIGVVYFMFIKKKPNKIKNMTKNEKQSSSDMVECATCSTYAELGDSIISSNKYYCSKECLGKA